MATINDISKLVGVSKATVSRAINGTGQVKESTRNAIFEAMAELGFRPNTLARALATNSSNSIGLVLSDFDGSYFGALLKQAAKATGDAGKQLIVTDGHNDVQREIEAIHSLVARRCDAIILYSRSMTVQDFCDLKQEVPVPIVVINRQLPAEAGHSVCFDQRDAAYQAVSELLEHGHHQIACISCPLETTTGQLRLEGYQEALQDKAMTANPQLMVEGHYSPDSGYQACQELLSRGKGFSALFACSDDMAIGAIRALNEAGLGVPQDVSVIGIDNVPLSGFVTPPLSTINIPVYEITDSAMKIALQLADGQQVEAGSRMFCGELIKRESIIQATDSED
ncbi:LacI family DNA-binding transcriptional regulator [Dongshaea marina]|uniref:LacI family DNA-binding transcriptional regulator n=1 Tax=Dongshaea marina TaxID=2047966 RepID=UPI000D3E8E23|nr:LacI family DNA-binding transcriptional regulator [Dongshaea marina]